MSIRTNTAKWLEKYNRWQIKVQKDGERKTFTSSTKGRRGQLEANAKADKWLNNNLINQNMRVQELSALYMEEKALNVGTSRTNNIKSMFKVNILPALKNKKVSVLCEQDLQNVLNKMYKGGHAYRYISECKKTLLDFMKFARKNNLTVLFPESLTINKNAPKTEKDTLQPIDIIKLFKSSSTLYNKKETFDMYIYAYRFMVLTGLRRGELVGLMWSDLMADINGDVVLYMQRAINENMEITEGKTKNSKRTIYLEDLAVNILEQQKQMQKDMNIQSEYIFSNKYGEFITPNNLWYRFSVYAKYNKLSTHTLHELRHTFISVSSTENVPLQALKELVGHSPKMDTLGTYGHTINGEIKKASKKINNKYKEILRGINIT